MPTLTYIGRIPFVFRNRGLTLELCARRALIALWCRKGAL